ncbi:acetyl-CoA sensor PanZ family protein [Stutzerimonas kirkiae]|uniref:Aspartate 1-decarboxylase autocleavage activator PanM n=1 Tax=Stutzerimonas kirkiae TaxID=2211392 RepID=A0A4Q9RFN2_9GAMM|nr:acetyl-CoA sensor PanZ family protein [Stutzerimonas kirkiae]TBU99313.1 aspartate 1-decarboxylase autocleavage activator PanM [Stutzerimonas kirkiae]TBV05145.1 aspartate 1-decarboxylase autocleavage activator PanM [Stutzerimonas kirkiae]TBV06227.1 aspartate 1-decarboxylase autocleavage activator PanM [Stutzerimonas kirkiae]TBV11864.1 aspartate 1-decarboxylase autocleavage activator PanM [Stutzerimonas kirkiae]
MPVHVETVSAPSEQDRIDLSRIYQDAPGWLLPPHASAGGLIESALASGQLIAGRFNDRLLGAALLQPDETGWRLSHLCVRGITRQRGVGRRIIEEARRRAEAAGQSLHLCAPTEHQEVRALAARMQLTLAPL